jgi:hypothetical protein
MAQTSVTQPTDLAGSLNNWFRNLSAPAATGNASAPPVRSWSAPIVNDEAAIQRGHVERRRLLGLRRAEQQLIILLTESQRLGVTLSTDAMARTVIAAYTDTIACSRR